MGVVSGDMLVDGCKLGLDFQRGTGYCQQGDLHDGTATIREALEFSAVLRQDRKIPREEKIAYVDKIIDLLELRDMQDAIISCLGVEQRKRLTIVSLQFVFRWMPHCPLKIDLCKSMLRTKTLLRVLNSRRNPHFSFSWTSQQVV